VRFASFEIATPAGRVRRVGAVADGNLLVDLNAAYASALAERVDPERVRSVADAVVPPDLIALLANGRLGADAVSEAIDSLGDAAKARDLTTLLGARIVYALEEVRLLAPLPRPSSLRDCSAFEEHVKNTAGPRGVPRVWYEVPVYYKGNPASVQGTGGDVVRPPGVTQLDYELEFAFAIGRRGRDIPETRALEHVAGYMVFNDVSARDLQMKEMGGFLGPAKGKDLDGGNVLGPWLVTPDEFDPSDDHAMVARVDGREWSRGSTASLYHSVARIVSHISRSETLYVGDVIGSGTVGRGCGLELGRYPEMGQRVELEIEGLGSIQNRFVSDDRGR